MKPHSPSRKVGTFIFGSFILASAALIVGILIHRSKPAAAQASASSPAARETTTTPRTRPLSQDEAVAAAERDATANARPCDYTVLTHLDLTRPPSEAELIAAGNLGKRLTPTRNAEPSKFSNPAERKRQESENLEFGKAIQAWNEHRYADSVKQFEDFLAASPESPWAAEAMLHIGCFMQFNARFGEAAEWFDKANAASGESSEMFHKSKLRRSIINIDLGRLDEASKGLAENLATDTDASQKTYASYWIMQTSFLKKHEAELRDCGQKALSKAAEILGDNETASTLFNLPSAGAHGFTAEELYATALQHGCDPHPVQAAHALDLLPVPFIAHYKDKHYVTVQSITPDTVLLYDSRISGSTQMPRGAFEREWSGFALLMRQPPESEDIHRAVNLQDISGGCCGIDRLVSDLGNTEKDCRSCGLPSYSVNPINMNFKVIDTPMWWNAPAGPDVNMTLLFNSQDSQNNYFPFGSKWSFEYASYLMITPAQLSVNPPVSAKIDVHDGDGRTREFTATTLPPVAYPPGVTYKCSGDFRNLQQTADNTYTLTQQDGTIYHYGLPTEWIDPNGPNYTPPPPGYVPPTVSAVPMLLKIEDRHHNAITIRHNANAAVVRIEHSSLPGLAWNIVYDNVGSVSRVFRIDDPFGRSAYFNYDTSARLTSQKDMGGLQYSYQYAIGTAGLVVTSITTPTGTTNVTTEPSDGVDNRNDANTYSQTDQNNGYSYVYPLPGQGMWDNYRITTRDHANNPSEYYYNGATAGGYTHVRSPAQMARPYGAVAPYNGSQTEIRYSLVGTKAVISSRKEFNEDTTQASSWMAEDYDEDTILPRKISNGPIVDLLTYNSQGRPTLIKISNQVSTDYQVSMTYQPNGIDPDTATRPFGGTPVTLADYNFDSNRDLQSVTDASGRTISYEWNTNGLPKKITDAATGDIIEFSYDSNQRPYSVKLNTQIVLTTTYDNRGNLLQSLDAQGRLIQYSYDDLQRLTRELRPDSSFTAYDWACCFIRSVRSGKLVNSAETTLRRSINLHDSRALPLSTTDSDGRVTFYEYDPTGRLTKLTDPKNQVTEWTYNAVNQMTSKKYAHNSTESFSFDSYGRMASFTNRRGQSTSLDYDPILGKLEAVNAPEATVSYIRDTWGRVSQITQDPTATTTGGTHVIAQDSLGRVTTIDGPWTDDTISYAYNDATRSVTRTSPGGMTQTTTANAAGQTASIANILGTFSNTYGGLGGALTAITHSGTNAGFNTAFTYHGDTFDRALATLTSAKPGGATIGKHSYTYDTSGSIATWKREAPLANPTGLTRQFDSKVFYDRADQVSSVIHTPLVGSSVVESAQHYVYDAAGNIASRQVETPAAASTMVPYTHNALNQLTGIGGSSGARPVTVRGGTSEPAKLKAKTGAVGSSWKNARMLEGNRFEADLDLANGANSIQLQAKDGSANQSNYSYALTLAAASPAVPTYDADGNMTSDGERNFEWDSQSRLTKIISNSIYANTVEFKYNGLGQRSTRIESQTIGANTTKTYYHHLYDGIHLLDRRITEGQAFGRRFFLLSVPLPSSPSP